ncbi:GvpL/GvpF family gas vesicle protein [Streptomyces sp. NPDC006296]|uniref:GvpL/GvpF family gas vesicle protein n=1 Tax=Streptomyces sp. NPDC006296 TaxID=3156746 RepID=UPI0033B5BB12
MTDRGPEQGTAGSALYVFAVCRQPDPSALTGLPGVATGEALRRLRFGELTAIVQTVRAADFTDDAWQARMADRGELERYARAHHDVVAAVAASCPTVPLPMATLYHGEERARQALLDETERFRTVLRRITDHSEWGVKVYAAEAAASEPARTRLGTPARDSLPTPGAGLAYLERKRGAQVRRDRRHEDSLRLAETVDAAFRGLAVAGRRLRLHAPEPTGTSCIQVLNATYLVAEGRAAELEPLTRALRESTGARVDISGPWAPYSFVGGVE